MTERIPTSLPPDLIKYAESREFSATDTPQKLLSSHRTKVGTWGLLCVIAGVVDYVVGDRCYAVRAGETVVIEPDVEHFVRPSSNARFKVEFYRAS